MATSKKTRKASKPSKASKASAKRSNGKAVRAKAKSRKANGAAARKASKANGKANGAARKANGKGGGKALSDFANTGKLRVLNAKEIPARKDCFKTGQTVSACLAAQKAKDFRGRRKFLRAQISQGRISVS